MSVSTTEAGVIRIGNGATTVFSFSFEARLASEIKVSNILATGLDPVLTGFVVALTPGGTGGTVTFGVAPANGVDFYIFRETALTQLVSVSSQQKYDPQVVEAVWDKLTFQIQEIAEENARAIKAVPGQTGDELLAAIAAAEASATSNAALTAQDVLDAETAKAEAEAAAAGVTAALTSFPALNVGQALKWIRVSATGLAYELRTIAQAIVDLGVWTALTGSAKIPKGTTAQRDAVPDQGMIRYNTTLGQYEGYAASGGWKPIGGGGLYKGDNGEVGSSAGDIFRINAKTLTVSTTIDADENASCTGPLTVNPGVTLTVATGGTLAVI
jgi:hypothetical protein